MKPSSATIQCLLLAQQILHLALVLEEATHEQIEEDAETFQQTMKRQERDRKRQERIRQIQMRTTQQINDIKNNLGK